DGQARRQQDEGEFHEGISFALPSYRQYPRFLQSNRAAFCPQPPLGVRSAPARPTSGIARLRRLRICQGMPMRRLSSALLLLLFLAGCSPTTPLFVAHVATHEVVEYKTLKSKRMAAAVEEEGDLLTYSALAIRDAHSPQAEQLYLSGYRDRGLS